MDAIFKALNDPTRRMLLDALRQQDGQTLTQLEERLAMSRFGVMKHLRLLEEAALITTLKKGRFKYHYLNALPLQEVIDRWIEPLLGKPTARGLIDLKTQLEGQNMPLDTAKPDLMMHTYIDCTHDALWDALTKGDLVRQYHFASPHITGDNSAVGETLTIKSDSGDDMLNLKVLSVDPKSRVEMSFQPGWNGAGLSRCVYRVEPAVPGMKLTVEHYDLGPGSDGVHDGWTRVMAGVKTWLETGRTRRYASQAAPQPSNADSETA